MLPAGQGGPDGEPVFLFFDGHASRWNLGALLYLAENRVFTICFPSHTSIWSQPNDNGANASFKAAVGRTLRPSGCAPEASTDVATFDKVRCGHDVAAAPRGALRCTRVFDPTRLLPSQTFRKAYIYWPKEMAEQLAGRDATNAVKSAWLKVRPYQPFVRSCPTNNQSSLEASPTRAPDHPDLTATPALARLQVGLGGLLNPFCAKWTEAIETFGEESLLAATSGGGASAGAGLPAGAGGGGPPGPSPQQVQRKAAGERMVTRLCQLPLGKPLQLRGVSAAAPDGDVSARVN